MECIQQNVPVSTTVVERDDSMSGLDVTAKWELLTPNPTYTPIPEPVNEDSNLRPPTEREGTVNPKFAYDERFDRMPFKGTTLKMQYKYSKKKPGKRKRGPGKSKLSPTRKSRTLTVKERVEGGPN